MKFFSIPGIWLIASMFTAYAATGTVTGVVMDTSGIPIPGVSMVFTSQDDERFRMTTTTDEKGSFTVAGVKTGDILITLNKEGYQEKVAVYEQTKRIEEIEIEMLTVEEGLARLREEGLTSDDPKVQAVAFYETAVEYYETQDYEKAFENVQTSLEKDPELAAAIKLAAFCSYNTQRWEEAHQYAESYLEYHPDDENIQNLSKQANNEARGVSPSAMYNKAVDAINADDDETAEGILLELIKLEKDYALAYYDLGQIKVRAGEFEAAIDYLKTFLKLAPDHEDAQDAKDIIAMLSE